MNDAFGKRNVFSLPFVSPADPVVADQTVSKVETGPEFEAPWGTGPRKELGSVMVRGLDPDVFATPTPERIAEIANNYPTGRL
jgi:hypothetical protein